MITYFVQSAGIYVAYGLSSDTKPSPAVANCLFIETDTGKTFTESAAAWIPTPLTTGSALALTDVTNNNADTSRHGFFPKLPTATGKVLSDDLTWVTMAAGGVWGAITGTLANQTDLQNALNLKALVTDLALYQLLLVSAVNIKTINGSSVLGAGDLVVSGATDIKQVEVDFNEVPLKMKKFTVTDGAVSPSNQISAWISYDQPSDGDTDSAEWFENLTVMARAGTGQFFLYINSPYSDTNGKIKINYLIG